MMQIFAIGLELFIGMFIGFYFTDRKQGLSFNDVKIASVMFLTLNAVLLFTHNTSWLALAHMIASFVVLFGGILVGEYLRIHLARKVVSRTVRKEDIYQTIQSFIEQANRVVNGEGSHKELEEQLITVQGRIDQARLRVHLMKQPEMFARLNHISGMCEKLCCMSQSIQGEDAKAYRQISVSVSELSWDTLQSMEAGVTKSMTKPMTAMALSVKSISMK